MNSLFICHGGPTLAIDDNKYVNFLKTLGDKYNPSAIIIFTAHWVSDVTTISALDNSYNMIYDFYGFPDDLYSIKYNAKGSTKIAEKIQNKLTEKGIPARLNTSRGLDHGSWVLLHLIYPEANIPIIQVSVNPDLPLEKQYQIGKALQELDEENVLIIGSGATVHNLSKINFDSDKTENWALEFDDWLIDKVIKKDVQSLYLYEKIAPHSKMAVPSREHLVPLFIALGSSQSKNIPKLLHRSYEFGSLSYICFEC
jgi:4,5-DOPA dioxygenase extradiol